ncbi:hypothetical protein B0O80DRAFT_448623 [Mortierella sp. GBAus27b]|nr:hypothetical protein B0O80DRAFT_448623 [Mortierella sp. GBAus27b]
MGGYARNTTTTQVVWWFNQNSYTKIHTPCCPSSLLRGSFMAVVDIMYAFHHNSFFSPHHSSYPPSLASTFSLTIPLASNISLSIIFIAKCRSCGVSGCATCCQGPEHQRRAAAPTITATA